MNELKIFNNPDFGELRTVEIGGEPWIVLKDVCQAFGETNYRRVSGRLDDDEKGVSQISTPGGVQNMTVVNESGLYSALFLMQPEKARGVEEEYIAKRQAQLKKFKRWVTSDVLPSIRKHGMYATTETVENMLADPDTAIRLLNEIKAEREKRAELEAEREANRPKVIFADSVAASKTSILVGELAKLLKQNGVPVGQNRLFGWMRENGFLIRRKGSDFNMPTQRAMEMGLFEIKETSITHADGHTSINKTPKVTGKGQQYFVNALIAKNKKSVV